jgi:hypothetical protein
MFTQHWCISNPYIKINFRCQYLWIFSITTNWKNINYLYREADFLCLWCATSSSICLFSLVYGRELCLYAQTLLYSLLHYSVPSAWLFRQLRVWGPETPPPTPPPLFLSHTPPPLTPSFTFPGRPGTWGKYTGQYAKAGRYGGSRPCRLALHDGTSWEAEAAGGGEGLEELPGTGN